MFKLGGAENLGHSCINCSVSQKVQIFSKIFFLIKCSKLFGCLSGIYSILIFNIFTWFLGGVKGRVEMKDKMILAYFFLQTSLF